MIFLRSARGQHFLVRTSTVARLVDRLQRRNVRCVTHDGASIVGGLGSVALPAEDPGHRLGLVIPPSQPCRMNHGGTSGVQAR